MDHQKDLADYFRLRFTHLTLPVAYKAVVRTLTDQDYDQMADLQTKRSELLKAWQELPTQTRPYLKLDRRLVLAAQLRAVAVGVSGQMDSGWGNIYPVDVIARCGLHLPAEHYPPQTNKVETVLCASQDLPPVEILEMLSGPQCPSAGSILHINGLGFHATQVNCGVGVWQGERGFVWCFLSAHPESVWSKL